MTRCRPSGVYAPGLLIPALSHQARRGAHPAASLNICHQANLAGRDDVRRIAAHREDYLVRALREYISNARVGYEPIMLEVMRPLGEAEIVDLAYTIARAR